MAKKRTSPAASGDADYQTFLVGMADFLEQARRIAARSVNALMTATYWEVGHRIVEHEQEGQRRADYGEQLLARLAHDLTARCGRGFSLRNLYLMRAFYLARPEILQTPSAESDRAPAFFDRPLGELTARFPLSWSHYIRLLTVDDPKAREFYEAEALRGGWTTRQLNRQIGSQFYRRTLLSRNKAAMLARGQRPEPGDEVSPEQQIKDPFVLEFLDLRDEYSESELEAALIRHLESFLLELGDDFTFVGRQKRLRVEDQWYRVDLVFFHRGLRCLVLIDLKLDELTPGDIGQMNFYLNYARHHWMRPGENPPVGLILCAEDRPGMARYALEGLPNKVLASQYRTALPSEELLIAELDQTRQMLESRSPDIAAEQKPPTRRAPKKRPRSPG